MSNKKLKDLVSSLQKEFGEGSIMLMGEQEPTKVDVINTGVLSLDKATGGFPRGRVIELYGPEAGGKTLTSLYVIAEAQRQGLNCAFIDVEHALNLSFAKTIGVDVDNLLVSQPDNAEAALELAEKLARSGEIGVIVLDSVAALVPRAEIEGEMGDSHMGLTARLMSQALRKLTPVLAKSNTMMIFINQVRMKIGVMFGNPETTTGGNALKFYASLRLEVRKGEPLKDKDRQIGHMMNIKIIKNKIRPPFGKVTFPLVYENGFDLVGDVFNVAVEAGIIDKSGAWFSYAGNKLGQGATNSIDKLSEDPKLLEEITEKVKAL